RHVVERRRVVHFSVGNMHETRNAATQIEQRVQLHRALSATKRCPGEQAQTQVDRGRVESVNRLFQFHGQRLLSVQLPGSLNQRLREVGIDPPVVSTTGVGQRAPRDASTKPRVIQLGFQRAETGFDVAQAFAKGQLSERETEKLIATGETARTTVASVSSHAGIELV